MKRAVLILFLLSLPLVSSLSIEMKENFQPGETLLAVVEGNFLSPILPEQVYWYADRVSLPLVFDITMIQDKYYIYAILPFQERNYTLIIKNIHYFENSQEKTIDITNNFEVSGNITEFSVYPGFIIAKENFTITIESMNKALTVTSSVMNQTKNIIVPAGQKKKQVFNVKTENFTLTSLSLSSFNTQYNIPTAILPALTKTITPENKTINITESEKFRFSRTEFNFSVNKAREEKFSIYLINVGSSEIKDIQLKVSDNLKNIASVSPLILDLKEAESKKVELTLDALTTGMFKGDIRATSGNLSADSVLTINSFDSNIVIPAPDSSTKESCSYYGGIICSDDENCKGSVIDALEGECCIGACEKKKSYTGIVIGIVLLIVIAIGLFFFYKKSKAKRTTSKEEIERKSKEFESRLLGQESRGSLSRS